MMFKFVVRRILASVPTVFGVAVLVFILFHCFGGDPALVLAGKYANAAQLVDLRKDLGLDGPLWKQFLHYLREIVTLDFGRSFATKRPVREMILTAMGPSICVTIPAFLISTVLAVGIGMLCAHFKGRWLDRVVVGLSVAGMSTPILAYILFGQYILGYQLRWFPISGWDSGFPQWIEYVGMPVLIWVTVSIGYDSRYFRAALIEEVEQDYVRTARAKGVSEFRVHTRHVLANGLIPIITQVVVQIPALLLGSFLLEGFFGIPGIGGITLDALRDSDLPVIKAMTFFQALVMIVGNILTDVFYAAADPRVKIT